MSSKSQQVAPQAVRKHAQQAQPTSSATASGTDDDGTPYTRQYNGKRIILKIMVCLCVLLQVAFGVFEADKIVAQSTTGRQAMLLDLGWVCAYAAVFCGLVVGGEWSCSWIWDGCADMF